MFKRMLALTAALLAAVPVLLIWVGKPWPDRILTWSELETAMQFEPERLVGGVTVALGWTMWALLATYAVTGLAQAFRRATSTAAAPSRMTAPEAPAAEPPHGQAAPQAPTSPRPHDPVAHDGIIDWN